MRSRDKLRLLQGYEPKQNAIQRVEKENNEIVNVSLIFINLLHSQKPTKLFFLGKIRVLSVLFSLISRIGHYFSLIKVMQGLYTMS